jgi:hypothetical protein
MSAWPALGQFHLLLILRSGPFAVLIDKELSQLFRFAVGWQHMSCWSTSERTNYRPSNGTFGEFWSHGEANVFVSCFIVARHLTSVRFTFEKLQTLRHRVLSHYSISNGIFQDQFVLYCTLVTKWHVFSLFRFVSNSYPHHVKLCWGDWKKQVT